MSSPSGSEMPRDGSDSRDPRAGRTSPNPHSESVAAHISYFENLNSNKSISKNVSYPSGKVARNQSTTSEDIIDSQAANPTLKVSCLSSSLRVSEGVEIAPRPPITLQTDSNSVGDTTLQKATSPQTLSRDEGKIPSAPLDGNISRGTAIVQSELVSDGDEDNSSIYDDDSADEGTAFGSEFNDEGEVIISAPLIGESAGNPILIRSTSPRTDDGSQSPQNGQSAETAIVIGSDTSSEYDSDGSSTDSGRSARRAASASKFFSKGKGICSPSPDRCEENHPSTYDGEQTRTVSPTPSFPSTMNDTGEFDPDEVDIPAPSTLCPEFAVSSVSPRTRRNRPYRPKRTSTTSAPRPGSIVASIETVRGDSQSQGSSVVGESTPSSREDASYFAHPGNWIESPTNVEPTQGGVSIPSSPPVTQGVCTSTLKTGRPNRGKGKRLLEQPAKPVDGKAAVPQTPGSEHPHGMAASRPEAGNTDHAPSEAAAARTPQTSPSSGVGTPVPEHEHDGHDSKRICISLTRHRKILEEYEERVKEKWINLGIQIGRRDYEKNYDRGYDDGLKDMLQKHRYEGYVYQEKAVYERELEDSRKAGYERGFQDGRHKGFLEGGVAGHAQGYEMGWDECMLEEEGFTRKKKAHCPKSGNPIPPPQGEPSSPRKKLTPQSRKKVFYRRDVEMSDWSGSESGKGNASSSAPGAEMAGVEQHTEDFEGPTLVDLDQAESSLKKSDKGKGKASSTTDKDTVMAGSFGAGEDEGTEELDHQGESDWAETTNREPFVAGSRFVTRKDGTVVDQREKLTIRVTDPRTGKRHVSSAREPQDWTDKKEMAKLNKWQSQYFLRATGAKKREARIRFVHEERDWLAKKFEQEPTAQMQTVTDEFNAEFVGKMIGSHPVRPVRTRQAINSECDRNVAIRALRGVKERGSKKGGKKQGQKNTTKSCLKSVKNARVAKTQGKKTGKK